MQENNKGREGQMTVSDCMIETDMQKYALNPTHI